MKKLLTIVCAITFALPLCAQITWNAKGGIGVASCIAGSNTDTRLHLVGKVGFGLEKPLTSNLSLMPSLEIAWKGGKNKLNTNGYESDESLNIFYAQIPVVLAYRINLNDRWNMVFKGGPYVAFAIIGKDEQNFTYNGKKYSGSLDIFDKDEMGGEAAKRFDVGIDIGIDFEYHRYVVGLEYELGFISMAPNGKSLKNQAGYITIGYKF